MNRSLDPVRERRLAVVATFVGMLCALALCMMVMREDRVAGVLGAAGVMVLGSAGLGLVMRGGGGGGQSGPAVDQATLAEIARHLGTLSTQTALSEQVRRMVNRDQERSMLRGAIERDIASGELDSAMVLIDQLGDGLGRRAEAEEFRARVQRLRHETVERQVGQAMEGLDGLIAQRRWEEAHQEAARIQRLYDWSALAQGAGARVREVHTRFKAELEQRFMANAQGGDVDGALEALRELDAYLTPEEAQPLREMARGVLGKARDTLGANFKLAVQDKRWADAVAWGEQIIERFPNSRMAAEVRDVIDGIRTRVG